MKDSGWWKPALFLIPFAGIAFVSQVKWNLQNAWLGCISVLLFLVLMVLAFRAQVSTSAKEPYWTPSVTGARIENRSDGTFAVITVSASSLHHVGWSFQLPPWGAVITQIERNKLYQISIEAPYNPLIKTVTQEEAAKWYLEDWLRTNGIVL